jgi:hypothetical protein
MTKEIHGRSRCELPPKQSTSLQHAADPRPLSVTVIAWVYIAAGTVGFIYHIRELNLDQPFASDMVWVCLVRLLAIVAGWFMLRGRDWARWLALVWIAYHVILSALHPWSEVLTHALLFAVIVFSLLRPSASRFFRQPRL